MELNCTTCLRNQTNVNSATDEFSVEMMKLNSSDGIAS